MEKEISFLKYFSEIIDNLGLYPEEEYEEYKKHEENRKEEE